MQISVITPAQFLEAVKTNGSDVLTIDPPKAKTYKGATFMDLSFKIDGRLRKQCFFGLTDVRIINGPPNPEDTKDPRNEFAHDGDKHKVNFETSVSECGDFGTALCAVNTYWKEKLTGSKCCNNKQIHELTQTVCSDKNKNTPGASIKDPLIKFKVEFEKFSDKHPIISLRNKVRTEILDYNKPYITKAGKQTWKPATVTSADGTEVPVNYLNIHQFVTSGAIIRHGRVSMSAGCISAAWVSVPMLITLAVIERAGADAWSDDIFVKPATTTSVVTRVATPDIGAAIADDDNIVEFDDVDIDAAIADI